MKAPPKKKKRRPGLLRRLYHLLVAISVVIIVVFCAGMYFTRLPDLPTTGSTSDTLPPVDQEGGDAEPDAADPNALQRKEGVYTFLLCGTDHGNGGTDTIMAVTYDTVNQTVGMVSIPRDTIILNSSGKVRKINSAYNNGGIDQVKTEVTKLLGIPIDYYIKIDLNGFVDGIDALGGIDFEVPVDMNYDDPTPGQELHIHFEAGMQHLDGQEALEVARYRHDNDPYATNYSDANRMETQRGIIMAALQKAMSNPFKVPELVGIVMDNVETDLSLQAMTAFATQVLTKFDTENITSDALPGDYAARYPYPNGGWYVALDPQGTVDLVNQLLNPYTRDLTLDDVTITTLNSNHELYTA